MIISKVSSQWRAFGLGLVLCAALAGAVIVSPALTKADGMTVPQPQQARGGLYNGATQPVRVQVEYQGNVLLVPEQRVAAGESITFFFRAELCREAIDIWVNGKPYPHISGHLCPEHYPDELKTIYIFDNGKPIIVGEDRD